MRKWAPLLFLLACTAWYLRETVVLQVPGLNTSPSDFQWYHRAAHEILRGNSPYVSTGYIYPPLLALLLTPLGALDYVTARWLWFGLSQAFLAAAAWLTWRASGRDWAAACWVALVWAVGGAAAESLGLGQVGPLLTLALVVAYTQAGGSQAAAVGLGSAVKFIPGVVGIALALARRWRSLAAMLGSALAFLTIPWMAMVAFLSGPNLPAGTDTWNGTAAVLSWSVPSVVLRILDPPRRGIALPLNWLANSLPDIHLTDAHRWVSLGVALAVFAAGVAALAVAARGKLSCRQVPWAMAALVALGLAASPVCWTHYQVMQYPGMALLLAHAWRRGLWNTLAAALACGACLYPLPVAILRGYYQRYGAWTAASPATLYIWTSVTPLACLVLFWLFVRRIRAGWSISGEAPAAPGATAGRSDRAIP